MNFDVSQILQDGSGFTFVQVFTGSVSECQLFINQLAVSNGTQYQADYSTNNGAGTCTMVSV